MKTPRELLLERHRKAQSKLDAIRRETLADWKEVGSERATISLGEVWRAFRWHLAGMSTVWLFVLLLHLNTSGAPQIAASNLPANSSPPQVVMASVRENRRQLAEMIESPVSENQHLELFLPKPRSERRSEMFTA